MTLRRFLESAKARGQVVDVSARVEHLSPAEVAKRLGTSRSTVPRLIADGDLLATKVGSHHRVTLAEFERYSREPVRRMTETSAADIEAELFGVSSPVVPAVAACLGPDAAGEDKRSCIRVSLLPNCMISGPEHAQWRRAFMHCGSPRYPNA